MLKLIRNSCYQKKIIPIVNIEDKNAKETQPKEEAKKEEENTKEIKNHNSSQNSEIAAHFNVNINDDNNMDYTDDQNKKLNNAKNVHCIRKFKNSGSIYLETSEEDKMDMKMTENLYSENIIENEPPKMVIEKLKKKTRKKNTSTKKKSQALNNSTRGCNKKKIQSKFWNYDNEQQNDNIIILNESDEDCHEKEKGNKLEKNSQKQNKNNNKKEESSIFLSEETNKSTTGQQKNYKRNKNIYKFTNTHIYNASASEIKNMTVPKNQVESATSKGIVSPKKGRNSSTTNSTMKIQYNQRHIDKHGFLASKTKASKNDELESDDKANPSGKTIKIGDKLRKISNVVSKDIKSSLGNLGNESRKENEKKINLKNPKTNNTKTKNKK